MAEVLGQKVGRPSPLVSETTEPIAPPIFDILDHALTSYRSGSPKALCPNPSLNQALTRLVAVSTAEFQVQQSEGPATNPLFHHDVVDHITQQLKTNAEMARRQRSLEEQLA